MTNRVSLLTEFQVQCATCGAALVARVRLPNLSACHLIEVEFCESCINDAAKHAIEEVEADLEELKQSSWLSLTDAQKDEAIRKAGI